MALYNKWDGFTYELTFFSPISDGLGDVTCSRPKVLNSLFLFTKIWKRWKKTMGKMALLVWNGGEFIIRTSTIVIGYSLFLVFFFIILRNNCQTFYFYLNTYSFLAFHSILRFLKRQKINNPKTLHKNICQNKSQIMASVFSISGLFYYT